MARALVTGANGFIGSHLVEYLLEQGHEVIALVRTTSDTRSLEPAFRIHPERLRVVLGDLREPGSLAAAVAGVDVVYHLGAVLMGTSRREFRETNVEGTRNLLDAVARRGDGGVTRVLFTSSQAAAGPAADATPIDETREPRPVSWYGESKRDAEGIVREHGARGLPVTIVRPVAVYGEREREISGGTFPAVRLGLMPRVGLRSKVASFIYVGDVVRGIVAAAESPTTLGKTYFLGDPEPYRATDVVRTVADAMGQRIRLPVIVPHFVLWFGAVLSETLHHFTRARPKLTRDKVREMRHRWWGASPAAAARDFGWSATTELLDGMRRAIEDWRRRRAEPKITDEPARDRAIKTYALALGLGVIVEGLAFLGEWYRFDPWWIVLVVLFGVFGGVVGSITYFAARLSYLWQFILVALVGIGAELANDLALHLWEFDPAGLGRIPGPWLRALALGLPAGLAPILLNSTLRALYRLRRRVG